VLADLADPLARALVWSAAADATRDAELAPAEFLALAAAALPHETDVAVFEEMLRFARTAVAQRYLAASSRSAGSTTLASACERTLRLAEPGSSRQLAAARGLVRCAGPTAIAGLVDWLDGESVPDGLVVDQDLRWMLLYRLVVHGKSGAHDIAAESERDPSGQGAEQAARCHAAIADADAKARVWELIVNDDVATHAHPRGHLRKASGTPNRPT
jgi:aminopeptidase N